MCECECAAVCALAGEVPQYLCACVSVCVDLWGCVSACAFVSRERGNEKDHERIPEVRIVL